MTYLSTAPGGLREAFITGGLPPTSSIIPTMCTALRIRVCARRIACILSVTQMMCSACVTSSTI